MGELVDIFKNKKSDEIERTDPLTTQELREFKKVLEASVDSPYPQPNGKVFTVP